jgi:hypothetical protein
MDVALFVSAGAEMGGEAFLDLVALLKAGHAHSFEVLSSGGVQT